MPEQTANVARGPFLFENWKAALQDQELLGCYECPIYSDAWMVGEEELGPYWILLAFQADANERGDRLAHARIDRLGVPGYLIGETGSQSDGITRFDFARTIPRLLIAAPAAFGCRLGVRHMSLACIIPMHLGNPGAFQLLERGRARTDIAKLDRINAMSAAPTNWRKYAIKLVGAGIGTAVAGPLGTALGGALGGLFSEQAEKLLTEYAGAGGEKLAEFGVHYCYDQLREMREHPPLEAVVREALHHALEEVRHGLDYHRNQTYAGWFDNWARRLNGSGAIPLDSLSDVVAKLAPGAPPADPNGTEATLDQLFRRTMERLDGEARAQQTADAGGSLSITSADSFRAMPDPLLQLLSERLPAPLHARFRDLVALPEHHRAWIAVEQGFQDYARVAFADLIATTRRIDERTERILEFQEQQLQRAEDEKRLAQEEARAARAEKQEWVSKYVKLMEDVAARKTEPGEPSLAALLEAGDLDGAIRLKTSQIDKRKGEIKRLAQDWSELGRVHDLRFAWRDAMECYRQAWQLDPDESEYGFRYAYFAQKQNRLGEAIDAYRKLLLVLTDPAQIATTLNNLAILYRDTQRMKESETAYLEALSTRRKLAEANPEAYLPNVATTLNNLAILYSATQRMKESETAYLEALSTRRKLAEANPEAYLPNVATTLNNLAILYSATQRMKESETAYLEALSTRRKLAEANPEAYLPDVAMTLNNLAILYRATQRMKESETAYLEALATYWKLAESNPEAYLPDVAMTLNNLAILYRGTQRMKESETAHLEALATYRKLAESNPEAYLPDVAMTLNNMAILYRGTQRMKESETAYLEALSTYRKLAEANPEAYLPDVATTLNNLANLYSDTQRMKESETAYLEALSTRRKLAEANPEAYLPNVATTLNNLANLYSATQRMKESEAAYLEALSTHRKLAESNPEAYLPDVAGTLNNLANLYGATQRMKEAEESCTEAQAICEPLWHQQPELHGNLMARIFLLRALLASADRQDEACNYARRGLDAAFDPNLKAQLQQMVKTFCAAPPEAR
jgi:tetratricopeptide (TPR) repeat protein